jgi:hypothetical protein
LNGDVWELANIEPWLMHNAHNAHKIRLLNLAFLSTQQRWIIECRPFALQDYKKAGQSACAHHISWLRSPG